MPTLSRNALHVEEASSRLHKLVLEWLTRETEGEGLTFLEAVYCLQNAQNHLIKTGIKVDREEAPSPHD